MEAQIAAGQSARYKLAQQFGEAMGMRAGATQRPRHACHSGKEHQGKDRGPMSAVQYSLHSVFDAYFRIYLRRTANLFRIYPRRRRFRPPDRPARCRSPKCWLSGASTDRG